MSTIRVTTNGDTARGGVVSGVQYAQGRRRAGEDRMELVNRMMDAFDDIKQTLPKPVFSGFRMLQDEKISRLQTVPLLQECTSRQLREIARLTDVSELPAGTVLARAGDPGDEFFLIVD